MQTPDLTITSPSPPPIRHRWTAGLFLLAAGALAGIGLPSVLFGVNDIAAGTLASAASLIATSYLIAGRRWHTGAIPRRHRPRDRRVVRPVRRGVVARRGHPAMSRHLPIHPKEAK